MLSKKLFSKNLFYVLFAALIVVLGCSKKKSTEKHKNVKTSVVKPSKSGRKKIIVFSSTGGGGHTSVSNAIKGYVGDKYDVKIVNVFSEVLSCLDPIRTLSFNSYSGEDLYNSFLTNNMIRAASMLSYFGGQAITSKKNKIEKLVRKYIAKENPSLVISVIPLLNFAFHTVAKEMNIPFCVITNDFDTTSYIIGLKPPYYKKFKYALAFDDELLKQKIQKAKIPSNQVEIVGFPIRPDFFEEKNLVALKKEWNVPEDKPVVMLLMGAAGSIVCYKFAKKLMRINMPMHLIVCVGRNEDLKKRIQDRIDEKLYNEKVSVSVVGFTSRISDLMAISDLLVTKPGPNSISEALYSNVPVLVDGVSSSLDWESLNKKFVQEREFGEILTNFNDLEATVVRMLLDPNTRSRYKANIRAFNKVNFNEKLATFIESMITL